VSTGCCFFALTDFENGFFVVENWMKLFDQFGENATFKKVNAFWAMVWTISEHIFLGRMSMKIQVKLNSLEMFLSNLQS
jgi:hypothetical protein